MNIPVKVKVAKSGFEKYYDYQLCFIEAGRAWFASVEPSEVWGDDWNDAPYEHNAGWPYARPEKYDLFTIRYEHPAYETPGELAYINSAYSVQDINAGVVAWLFRDRYTQGEYPPIMAGITLIDFVEKIITTGGMIYVPLVLGAVK